MSSTRIDFCRIFAESVPSIFGRIARDYSLTFEAVNEREFRLSRRGLVVLIQLGFGHVADVNVIVAAMGGATDEVERIGIGVKNFARYANPSCEEIDLRVWTAEDVPEKLNKLADLLYRYCGSLLKGDSTMWPKVVAFVEKRMNDRRSLMGDRD